MPKIRKPWISWEEFEKIQGGNWTPSAHTHPHTDIADWGDYIDQAVKQASHVIHASLTVANEGLHILDTNASHDLIIKAGSDLTADRILSFVTGDVARTITLNGNPTLNDWFDQNVKQASSPRFVNPRVDTLRLDDTGNDHYLSLILNENLAAHRTLNIVVGNATRTITLSGNPTLADWFDQDVKQAAVVSFGGITDTGTGATNLAAGTTGQRPGGVVGDVRYNSTLGGFEVYTGAWKNMVLSGDNAILASILVNNTGLRVKDTNASHYLTIKPGSDITANRILTLTTGDAARTITLSGNPTLANWFDQGVKQASHVVHASITVNNTGLHILDTNATHDLIIKPGSDLTADRILTLITGNVARTITLSGNPTLADWFDQTVKQAASPTFVTAKFTALTDGYVPYHVDDATGLANSGIFWDSGNSRVGINLVDPDEDLEVLGKVKATEFLGNLHWNYITNEPAFYPPEFHYHVGKEIVSLHLVDLDDVEADDIFDVLPTAAIHGEGNYDWFGTWNTAAGANCSANIVVLAGDDKYLRLTDNNVAGLAITELTCDAGHEMVTGVVEFSMRCSIDTELCCHFNLSKGGTANMGIRVKNVPPAGIYFYNGTGVTLLVAFAVDTWYKIRIHFDCVARAAVIFVDNVFKLRIALNLGAVCDFVDSIKIETDLFTGGNYTFDINNLKIFNLTI